MATLGWHRWWRRRGVSRGEAIALAAVLGYVLLVVARDFNFMAVPPTDYFSFRGVAVTFSRLELPFFFKRGPAFPLAMALARLAMPGPDPFLYAALALSAAAAAGNVVLGYLFARRTAGVGAACVAVLIAAYSQFQIYATAPLVEPFYLFLILAAVVTAGRGEAAAYAWAGAAAATRYEAFALVLVIWLSDANHWRGRARLHLYAALAALPAAAWVGAGFFHHAYFNPYLEEIRTLPAARWAFGREVLASLVEPRNAGGFIVAGLFALVAAAGLFRIVKTGGGPGPRVRRLRGVLLPRAYNIPL